MIRIIIISAHPLILFLYRSANSGFQETGACTPVHIGREAYVGLFAQQRQADHHSHSHHHRVETEPRWRAWKAGECVIAP